MEIFTFALTCGVPLLGVGLYVIYALLLATNALTYVDITHPQRGWLLVLVRTHVLEPFLTVPWVFMWVITPRHWGGYIQFYAVIIFLPMLILLLPWVGPQGNTAQTRKLIRSMRRFGVGRIGLNMLVWISLLVPIISVVLVVIGIGWLVADLKVVRRELVALQKETWQEEQGALRRAEGVDFRIDHSLTPLHNKPIMLDRM